jgi:nicotinamidase-related amidase
VQARQRRRESGRAFIDENKQALGSRGTRHRNRGADCEQRFPVRRRQTGTKGEGVDQQLKQYGVEKVIILGLVANTCIESTGRFAMELGYHVTLVADATAAFSQELMHAAHKLNGPAYAHEILTTAELIAALQAEPTDRKAGAAIDV